MRGVNIRSRWVMFEGLAGSGKTTLAALLADHLAPGCAVDVIREEDIFVREEFAEAGKSFRSVRMAAAGDLLLAYGRVARVLHDTSAAAVFDWNASGMAEDLPWAAGQADLDAHVRAVHSVVAMLRPVVVFLSAAPEAAFERAAAERGEHWVARYAALGPREGTGRARVLSYFAAQQPGFARDRHAYKAAGWPVVTVDANHDVATVLADVLARLEA
jgi:thymidylate kinase